MAESPALKPVYLLTGSDRPKIETALARLRRHFAARGDRARQRPRSGRAARPPRSATRAASSATRGSSSSTASTAAATRRQARQRLEGGRREGGRGVPRLARARHGARARRRGAEEGRAADQSVCEGGRRARVRGRRSGSVDAWVAERFKQAGVRAEPDAVAALVQLVGEDFHQLANEVDKLALWAGDEPIGEHEVEQLVAAVAETPTFALTDAWAQRDAAAHARRQRDDLRARGPAAPRHRTAHGRGARQPPRLHAPLPAARRRGRPSARRRLDAETAPVLRREGVRPGRATSPRTSCARAVVRLAELDHALKGGSKLAPDLELQRALIDLSAEG